MSTPIAATNRMKTYAANSSPTSIADGAERVTIRTGNDKHLMEATPDEVDSIPITMAVTVLTYGIVGSGVSVQVLADQHTIYDLINIVCKETCVGMNESVYDHMWAVEDTTNGLIYESGDYPCQSDLRASNTHLSAINSTSHVGSQLILEYDYGRTSHVELVLEAAAREDLPPNEVLTFPRPVPILGQADFHPYIPGPGAPNLDELYPSLSRQLFAEPSEDSEIGLEICLFQPGRKKVQAYIEKRYAETRYNGCLFIIHIPEKYDSIEEMFFALDESSRLDKPPDENFGVGWLDCYGASIFPSDAANRYQKYRAAAKSRFVPYVDNTEVRGYHNHESMAAYENKFLKTFPKCAAAAGFNQNGKKSKAAERGWIVYRAGTLMVCRGESQTIKKIDAPRCSCFDGVNKYQPIAGGIVGKVRIRINSLQELFCAAETLW